MGIFLHRSGFIGGAPVGGGGGGGASIPTPVSLYTMENFSAPTLSDDQASNDGTASSGVNQNSSLFKVGANSLEFTRSNAEAVDFGSVFDFGANADPSFSITFWLRLKDDTKQQGLITKDDVSTNRCWSIQFLPQASDRIRFLVTTNGSTATLRDSGTALVSGTWYHVACVYDANTPSMDIYLNASLDNGTLSGTVPTSIHTDTTAVRFGHFVTRVTEYFDGYLDQVRVYDSAISAAEISAIYAET